MVSAAPAIAARSGPLDFRQIYDSHVDFVWRMVERLGVSSANVEDAVQEVFLIVYRRRVDFREESSLRTWIGGIAVRVAKDFRRRHARKEDHEPLETQSGRAQETPGPLDHVSDAQAFRLVMRLLENLDEDQRTVFVLSELEELSAADIAELTAVSVNTVSSRLRLARAHFSELIAAQGQQGVLR